MNIEKVKEIKNSIERKINRAEKVGDDLVNCVSVIALKEYLTLINELESENERLDNLFDAQRIVAKQRLAKLEKAEHDRDRYQRRIVELEKENKDYYDRFNNLQTYIDNHEEIWKGNTKIQLKQFAERLKEKLKDKIGYDRPYVMRNIDDTLKEFLDTTV